MAEENVVLARKAIDALNSGDFDALLAYISPDVEWGALGGVPGMDELYRGLGGVREWHELLGMLGAEEVADRESRAQGVHFAARVPPM